MPTQITNYQCPACTGPLHFDGESGKLACEYCGSSFEVAEIEALYAEKEKKAAAAQQEVQEQAEAAGGSSDASGDGSGLGYLRPQRGLGGGERCHASLQLPQLRRRAHL